MLLITVAAVIQRQPDRFAQESRPLHPTALRVARCWRNLSTATTTALTPHAARGVSGRPDSRPGRLAAGPGVLAAAPSRRHHRRFPVKAHSGGQDAGHVASYPGIRGMYGLIPLSRSGNSVETHP